MSAYFNRLVGYYGFADLLRLNRISEPVESIFPGKAVLTFKGARHALFCYLDNLRGKVSGKYVICPGWSCSILPLVIHESGFVPLFVDIDPHTLQFRYNDIVDATARFEVAAVVLVAENGNYYSSSFVKSVAELDVKVILDYALAWQNGIENLPHNGDAEIYSAGYSKPVSGLYFGALVTKDAIDLRQSRSSFPLQANVLIGAHIALQYVDSAKWFRGLLPKDSQEDYQFDSAEASNRSVAMATCSSKYWKSNYLEYLEFQVSISAVLKKFGIDTHEQSVFAGRLLSKIVIYPDHEPGGDQIEFHRQYMKPLWKQGLGVIYSRLDGVNSIIEKGYSFTHGRKAFVNRERFLKALCHEMETML